MADDIKNILGIDSSTGRLSIAVSRNEKLLSEMTDCDSMKHMVNIMGLLDRTLRKAKLTIGDIDVFGVNLGPGDFTGTRIGISVIKTLAWLERKPSFGINSLDIYAVGISRENEKFISRYPGRDVPALVMPCLDVRKSEVYFSFYEITAEADKKHPSGIEIGDRSYIINKVGGNFLVKNTELKGFLNGMTVKGILNIPGGIDGYKNSKVLIGGNCFSSYGKTISDAASQNNIFQLDKKTTYPRARYLNICTYLKAARKVESGNLIPVYVREFVPFGGIKK
ncbi:MAG: tRNA (adenosine(37)-N6)-threonylcarbamoyltransferase complex dimerization subunit type 1 TsaB [Actinomycetota bacterium]|nr:tRNA (adenosine(37)-N6)-threonylcarbamoyltransferase complex dimerization subunit type 1 TsaB [Actinomycetota bacterium]